MQHHVVLSHQRRWPSKCGTAANRNIASKASVECNFPISRTFKILIKKLIPLWQLQRLSYHVSCTFPVHMSIVETNRKVDAGNFIKFLRKTAAKARWSPPLLTEDGRKGKMINILANAYCFGGFLQSLSIAPPCNYRRWS